MNLQNLVDYCEYNHKPSPFSGATVPSPLNIDTCISAIMIRCGLLTPLYGEPDVFRNITTQWFTAKQWTFEHLINIIQAEYSPIENVNEIRNEKTIYGHNSTKTGGYKDTEAGKDTTENSGKDVTALTGTDTVALSGTDSTESSGTDERDVTHSGTDTTTNTISAMNASTYQPDTQSETGYGHTIDDDITYGKTDETTYGKTEETTYGKTETLTNGKKTDVTYGHNIERVYNSEKDQEGGTDQLLVSRHGNIGVTTNQKMINEELELLRHFDVYGFIAELFEKDNMLMIY